MIVIKNSQRTYAIDKARIEKDLHTLARAVGYPEYDVTVWFTTNKTIRDYNKRFRGKDKATDVLSFPYYDVTTPGILPTVSSGDYTALGDIMISLEYVDTDRLYWNQTLEARIRVLLVHSVCHLIGYDHETDADYAVMQQEEDRLLSLIP